MRILLASLPLLAIAAAPPPASGPLMTLTIGRYDCEQPGDAGSQATVAARDVSFAVTSSSRYIAADGRKGTYLFTGDTVTMTSGPLAGMRLVRIRESFLRRIEANGLPGDLRCILSRRSDKN